MTDTMDYDVYGEGEYIYTNEICPECKKDTLKKYCEGEGPDAYRFVWICKNCGLTESE